MFTNVNARHTQQGRPGGRLAVGSANLYSGAHELVWEQNFSWPRTLLALDALLPHGTVLHCVMLFAGIAVYLACTPCR